MTTTWDEMGDPDATTPQHLDTADDLEQDLNALFERFRFEKNTENARRALADAAAAVIARYVAEGRIPETIADVAKRVRVRQDPLEPTAVTLELSDALRFWLTTGRVPLSKLMGGRVAVRHTFDEAVKKVDATAMLAALETVTRFGPVTIERRGERFAVVFSNGEDDSEKLEIGGYDADLPKAVAHYFDALLMHTNTA